jgi:hypothetical protein
VQLAENGVGGLTALDHFGFDLMIVDVAMPNMRVFEPIRRGEPTAVGTSDGKLSFKEGNRVHCDSGLVEQLKPNAQARRDSIARVLVVDDDPMVCMAIEV